jgi:uncharacterized repeat protein (TIGR02543 family)
MLPLSAMAAGNLPFTDVKTTDWFYDSVEYVYENGLMNGTSSTTFSPYITTTRGMIVTILWRLEGEPTASAAQFDDVAEGQYCAGAVQWAAANSIVDGYGNGKFGPEDAITREQAAAIMYRYYTYKDHDVTVQGDLSGYTDADQISPYAVDAMTWANATGLIIGSNGALSPQETATRAEAATILMRMCKSLEKDQETPEESDLSDVPTQAGTIDGIEDETKPTGSGNTGYFWNTDDTNNSNNSSNSNNSNNNSNSSNNNTNSANGIGDADSTDNKDTTTPSRPTVVYYTVTFDSNGGSEVDSQTVEDGDKAVQPEDPEKDGCTFIGWYCGTGYSEPYDFDAQVSSNITIYAKWYDETDTTDSDNDGLSDALEKEFGSDPTKNDTNDDGLSDYYEINWLNYDPTSDDSDGNGVPDRDEDPDDDGLKNWEEEKYGTIPICADTDGDSLSDYDEVYVYATDPLNSDTDGDGVKDGVEVGIGSDPLKAEYSFETSVLANEVDEVTPVAASATVVTDASGAGTLQVDELTSLDNPLLSQSIAGYLGAAYEFSTDGSFESAEISFCYDTSLGELGEDFQPRIYYFNEATGLLEELENQTVTEGMVSAQVEHFSTYILLNKVEFDQVWDAEIKPPVLDEEGNLAVLDIVFVIDYSASMDDNDSKQLFKELSKNFVSKLRDGIDRAAVVKFIRRATVVSPLSTDKDALYAAIDSISYDSGYGSYSGTDGSAGIKSALDVLSNSESEYQFVVFITDGEDNGYSYSYDDLISTANSMGAVIYTVGMGSASESVLRKVADGTGGKYYHATTDGSADSSAVFDLEDVYDEIQSNTVDLTTDSNHDGISDYYTKLLDEGKLLISTGSCDLVGVLEMYGEDCADWDGDGLLNGEEIEIVVTGNRVSVKVNSHPLLVDSDGDGYSDLEEVQNGTPPMKYTSNAYSALEALEDDSRYVYIDVANDRGIRAGFVAFFDWQKTDEAKSQLINYFYDYASEDTIAQNQENISKLKARETYLKYAQSLASLAKTAKNICTIADDVSEMVEDMNDSGTAKDFVDELKDKTIKLKGTSAQVGTSRKRILEALNTNQLTDDEALKTGLSVLDAMRSEIEDFDDLFQKYDVASFTNDLTTTWAKTTSIISTAVKTFKTYYDDIKYMKLNTGFKAISNGYQDFLKKNGTISTGTYVTAVLDGVDGGLEVWENCNTYGKMKANRDAYIAYIDLMYYVAENATEKYDRTAAYDIAQIIEDETWDMYEKQLMLANTKTVVLTSINIVIDITEKVCPYVKVAKTVLDIAKLAISVTGLSNSAKLYVSCRTMQSVSDGCVSIVNSSTERNGEFFSYDASDAYVYSYMVQLAQSRLVGENLTRDRMLKGDLGAILSRWETKTGKDDLNEIFRTLSAAIYNYADRLDLVLSSSLPYYSDFNGG